jgi:hypothetical protein
MSECSDMEVVDFDNDEETFVVVGEEELHRQHSNEDSASIAGWSEISAPASIHSLATSASVSPRHCRAHVLAADHCHKSVANKSQSQEVQSALSKSVFSWAEITKIQPEFQKLRPVRQQRGKKPLHFANKNEQKTKIVTRVFADEQDGNHSNENDDTIDNDDENKPCQNMLNKFGHPDHLPDIPEDPHATKDDFGRKARRAGRKGARIKYPNGRRGSRRTKVR